MSDKQQKLHSALIVKLIELYPKDFDNILGTEIQAHYRPGGIDIILNQFKKKNEGNVRICSSCENYGEQLESLPKGVPGVYYFAVLCAKRGIDKNIHQTAVTVFRDELETVIFITDSGPFDVNQAGDYISKYTYKVIPDATIYSTMSVRQRDRYNCGFFVIKDLSAIAKNPYALFDEIGAISKPVAEHHKHILSANRPDLLSIKVTAEVPLRLIGPAQSLSQINSFLKSGKKDDPFAKKLTSLKEKYSMAEMEQGKDQYTYTTLKSISYQLQLVEWVFRKASNLV